MRRMLLVLTGLLGMATFADAQVTFELKIREKSTSTTNHESKSVQTLTLAGMDIDTNSTMLIRSLSTVGSRSADGKIEAQSKIESMQSDISLGNGLSVQFDGINPDKKAPIPELEPLLDVLRAAARLTIISTWDAKNKLISVKLPDGEFEKLSEAAKEHFDSDTLRKQVEQGLQALPTDPVKPGDQWERSKSSNLGNGQTLTFRINYEYAGPIEKDGTKLEKIAGKVIDVNYAVNGNPSLQVTKSEIKVVKSELTTLFDPALGAIVSTSSKTQVAGPITLVYNNLELPGKVDLVLEETITLQK